MVDQLIRGGRGVGALRHLRSHCSCRRMQDRLATLLLAACMHDVSVVCVRVVVDFYRSCVLTPEDFAEGLVCDHPPQAPQQPSFDQLPLF